MKHIEFRMLFEQDFQFKESPSPSLKIVVPMDVQKEKWCIVPVRKNNIVS